jgi:hypothetical protein
MTILIGLSSLPFLHELLFNERRVLFDWVPNLGIQNFLTDQNGKILGYSHYRVFIYFFLIQIYTLVGWCGWFSVSKSKNYRLAILVAITSSAYHIFLILSNARKTDFNLVELKMISTLILGLLIFLIFYFISKKKDQKLAYAQAKFGHARTEIVNCKLVFLWLILIGVSVLPYLHDIITMRGEGVKQWIPNIGLEELLTNSNGLVWGFNSYRVFLLSLSLQIFAQIGWAGWLHDSAYKLYRPFLVVPVGLSLYQIVILLFDQTKTYMNRPDIKLLLILGMGAIICYLYFFKNKRFKQPIIQNINELHTEQTLTKNH